MNFFGKYFGGSDNMKQVLRRYFDGGLDVPPGNKELVLRKVKQRIAQLDDGRSLPLKLDEARPSRLPSIARYAAGILLLISLSYLGYRQIRSEAHEAQSLSSGEWIQKKVPNGRMLTVSLSDGSTVKLNSGSEILYPKVFDGDLRECRLYGEAWFEVASDVSRPFIVTTGNLRTRVLGTSFNIRAYPDERSIEVALAEGIVELEYLMEGVREVLTLQPAERAVYSPVDNSISKDQFDREASLGWKDGIIYFRDAGLDEIVEKLSRWYGVEFYLSRRPRTPLKYTGSFQDKSLVTVLQGIGFASNFDFEILDQKVIVRFN